MGGRTAAQTAITTHASAGQPPPPSAASPAWASQYEGSPLMTWNTAPDFAIRNPYTPPRRENRVTIPPTAGVLPSVRIRGPSRVASTADGPGATHERAVARRPPPARRRPPHTRP